MNGDVLAASGLSGWAEAGLVLFVLAFVLLSLRAFMTDKHELERRARLPLAEESSDERS